MNKPVYLGLSILGLSKTVTYEFWYDYIKVKYDERGKLCYMDTNSFITQIKTEDIYKDILEIFDTSNYGIGKPFPIGKNTNVVGVMKNELGRQIVKKFVGLRPKTYSYLQDDNDEGKKAKGTKSYVVKRNIKFEDYKKMAKCITKYKYSKLLRR